MSTFYCVPKDSDLMHYGVKGMRWGFRKSPEYTANRQAMKSAKAEYKQAKKDYNRAFTKYYYSSPTKYFTKSGRHTINTRYAKALTAASVMGQKKGAYLKAKGIAKNNPKQVAKGKYIAQRAGLAKQYYSSLHKDLQRGTSYKDTVSKNHDLYVRNTEKTKELTRKYKASRG